MVLAVIQLVNHCMVLSATDFISALAEWVVGLLTGGSPMSLLVVITLIVLIFGKLRGNDRY